MSPLETGGLPATTGDVCVVSRVEAKLDELDRLWDRLDAGDGWTAPPLDYRLPEGFLLSVVVPVYNEQATVSRLLTRVARLPLPKEIVVVDDASTDRTRDVLAALAPAPELRIVYKSRNEGKGAAVRTGLAAASGDVVVVQDADLEYDPRDIPAVIHPIVTGQADVVYGSRFLGDVPQDPSRLHRFGNRLLTAASNLCTGLRLTDMETCYKAFRRDVAESLCIRQNRFGFEPEVTAKIARGGYRICEVPITYRARGYDEGKKIGLRDGLNAFWCIARYAWRD